MMAQLKGITPTRSNSAKPASGASSQRIFLPSKMKAYRGLIATWLPERGDVIEYLAPPDTPLRHSLRQPKAEDAQIEATPLTICAM